jgi:tripeptidyl-peptidase-1
MGIAQDTATFFWYDGNRNPFLSWITEVSNDPNPPLSNSISWGSIEQMVDIDTMNSFNNEAIKLGLRGVTIIVAAGDHGAANIKPLSSTCMCNIDSGSSQSNWQGSSWQGKGYFPSFPVSCPYVTAVGGTQGPDLGLIDEIACSSKTSGRITTGGGWSTYYVQPSWQKEAVQKYLNILNSSTEPQPGFNINGRGYPDISLLAVHYEVIIGGRVALASGTSASAPVMAGYVSLVNAARAKQGKPSIGFLNKMLYEMGMKNNSIYRDIVSGDNKCCGENSDGIIPCCSTGFTSTVAWDPVSGWGSIDYQSFASIFSVAAPYNGTPPFLSRTKLANENQFILTRNSVIALLYVIVILFIVISISCCIYLCFRKRRSVYP